MGAFLITACGGGGGPGSPADDSPTQAQARLSPTATPPESTPPASTPTPLQPKPPRTFADATAASGIAYEIGYVNFIPWGLVETIVERFATGGVAAGDYDADGDIDLFITRGDIGPNLLYRNNGAGVFDEVAGAAGIAFTATPIENYRHAGPTFADVDGDEDLDLFIGGLFGDPSFIYRNNGDGTFSDVTPGSGIDSLVAEYNVSAAFGDYDLDGDLDLFVSHWGTERVPDGEFEGQHLWRNDSDAGAIRFTDVSKPAGISSKGPSNVHPLAGTSSSYATFTPSFARIDGDLFPDLVIASDFGRSRYFVNNGDGSFTNATDAEVITDRNGMGSALGDYDNDGDLDWFVTSIYWEDDDDSGNRFYENDHGKFSDRTTALGVRDGGWGWAACFFDFENDGMLDLYHTNGWELEGDFETDRSRAFQRSGVGPFVDAANSLGLDDTELGLGIVCADFDNDGDVDILQLHRGSPVSATLWRNDTYGNNYLKISLKGRAPNTEAAGARIYVTVGPVTQMREITIGNNFMSQNPTIQVFGLGSATLADEVRVQWPDGLETIVTAVGAGQTLSLLHPRR